MNRYARYGTVIEDSEFGSVQLGLPFGLDVQYNPNRFITHRVAYEESGRPDILAWLYLDDPYKWEHIMLYNDLDDPLTAIDAGVDLLIPTELPPNRSIRAFAYLGTDTP